MITHKDVDRIMAETSRLNRVKLLRQVLPWGLKESVHFLSRTDAEIRQGLTALAGDTTICPRCGGTGRVQD